MRTETPSASPRRSPPARRTTAPAGSGIASAGRAHGCGLQDLVGSAEFPVLTFEDLEALTLLGGQPRPVATVDFGSTNPLAKRLGRDPELVGDRGDRTDFLRVPASSCKWLQPLTSRSLQEPRRGSSSDTVPSVSNRPVKDGFVVSRESPSYHLGLFIASYVDEPEFV